MYRTIMMFVGVVATLSVLLGANIFRMGWRSRHPGLVWPTFTVVSFAGGLVIAAGFFTASWRTILIGIGFWIVARLLAPRRSSDA